MLELRHIAFSWPDGTPCFQDLSLTVDSRGVALTGANGAGKSTLLRVAAGLLPPASGQVLCAGRDRSRMSAAERAATVGVLFQEAERQIFHATVRDEVAFGLRRQNLSADETRQRTAQALEQCGLGDAADLHPLDLHSGLRRLVAVACLAAIRPAVLLLDEPVRDFDAPCLGIFERWLQTCRENGAVVLAISHDLDFVARHFSRAIRLEHGELAADTDVSCVAASGAPGMPDTSSLPALLRDTALQSPQESLPAPTLLTLCERLGEPPEPDPARWAQRRYKTSASG